MKMLRLIALGLVSVSAFAASPRTYTPWLQSISLDGSPRTEIPSGVQLADPRLLLVWRNGDHESRSISVESVVKSVCALLGAEYVDGSIEQVGERGPESALVRGDGSIELRRELVVLNGGGWRVRAVNALNCYRTTRVSR